MPNFWFCSWLGVFINIRNEEYIVLVWHPLLFSGDYLTLWTNNALRQHLFWRCWGSNRGPHTCKACALPLSYIPSWNSSTLATSCEELTHWKRPWCWERLKAGGEGDDREWDGWMASPTRWTWIWENSGSWWWTGRPGMMQSKGSQRVGHDWATELNWLRQHRFSILDKTTLNILNSMFHVRYLDK